MNNENKKVYSLNLAAFILTTTRLVPDAYVDEDTKTVYFTFPACTGVSIAVHSYKAGNPEVHLKDFLAAIKQLRTMMTDILKEKEEN